MLVDLRKDAPDQTDVLDPEKLSTEVEKLKSIQSEIKSLEDRAKDLKNDEKHFSCIVIPKLMEENNIIVSFGQGEDNKAVAYATLARSEGYEPIQEEKVHPQTLKVVMKEWKDKGREVPSELFWTFDGNQTSIKNKK